MMQLLAAVPVGRRSCKALTPLACVRACRPIGGLPGRLYWPIKWAAIIYTRQCLNEEFIDSIGVEGNERRDGKS